MSRGPDAATLLRRALERHAERAGIMLAIDGVDSVRWMSATFIGARHRLTLRVTGPQAGRDGWIGGLDDADLPMRGHLVADLIVLSADRQAEAAIVVIEALTVEA